MLTDKALWNKANVASLNRHYTQNQASDEGDFLARLETQLNPASEGAKQLAAEMLWTMYLFPNPAAMGKGTKLNHICQVWEWSGEPLPEAPLELDEALQRGVGHPGQAFGQHKWRELRYFIEFMERWTQLTATERGTLLEEPWQLAEWLGEQEESEKRQLRHILLYLLFPKDFEPFAAAKPKIRIVISFARELGIDLAAFDCKDQIAVDRQILEIRAELQKRCAPSNFDFHDNPYLRVWRPDSEDDDDVCLPSEEEKPVQWNREKALEDLFLSEEAFDFIVRSLIRKKNVVLEGSPGVGKTFIAKRLAYWVMGYRAPERVRMIQFHQSYSYEDFIQGYRPKKEGGFELRNGVFFTFCREAAAYPDDRYVFIIDEVNRGNLSKIFGELMLLIEADKRDPNYAVPLTYSPDDEPFHIPPNLYLIGMMNTADRSPAMVDYALRRRFAFVRISPAFQTDQFSETLRDKGVPVEFVKKIVSRLSLLNGQIRSDRRNLGPGFEIGHSFFCPGDNDIKFDDDWYQSIVRSEIEPLLREYWFDRPEEVDSEIGKLLE